MDRTEGYEPSDGDSSSSLLTTFISHCIMKEQTMISEIQNLLLCDLQAKTCKIQDLVEQFNQYFNLDNGGQDASYLLGKIDQLGEDLKNTAKILSRTELEKTKRK